MLISICSILKQFGVRSVTKSIKETSVFMPIIGKISGVNHIYTSTNTISVGLGKVKKIPKHTKMGAN